MPPKRFILKIGDADTKYDLDGFNGPECHQFKDEFNKLLVEEGLAIGPEKRTPKGQVMRTQNKQDVRG